MSKLSFPTPTRITNRQAGKVKSAQKADKVFIPHAAKNTLQCKKCTLNQKIPSKFSIIYDIHKHISYFKCCSHPTFISICNEVDKSKKTSIKARHGICCRTYASRYTHSHKNPQHTHTHMHAHIHILYMFFVYTDLFAHFVRFESG